MTQPHKVAVLVGSLRKDSLNRKMAKALIAVAPPSLSFEFVEIGELPFYNQDLEDSPPAPWVAFRERIAAVDAVLFVTPEYNRSVPAVLKNALDVASRPSGKGVWGGKAGAIVTVSPGAAGGFGSNHHLRQTLVALDVHALAQPEAYVGRAGDFFDADGNLTDERTKGFVTKFMAAFAAWTETIRRSK